jgi:hypothetical protein
MHRPIIALCLLVGLAHATPNHAAQEAPLAKSADKIKLYCGNPQLAFVIDWPAYENLDYQVLIAGREGGDPTVPNRAADPSYVAAARTFILTGNQQRSGLPGAPIGGRSGIILETFQQLCRDHADLRAAASKITKIVLEPINDMKYQSDKDAIAFARKTNDWSGVQKSMYESLKGNDAEDRRTYYLRWALKGSTLTVTSNVMARAGVADDYVKVLMTILGNTATPSDARPAEPDKTKRAPAPADKPAAAPQCRDNDRKCKKLEAEKAKKWGPARNCDKGIYAGLSDFETSHDYATGAFVYQKWSAEPTQVYRCTSGSGCHGDDRPGSAAWTQVGHCARE